MPEPLEAATREPAVAGLFYPADGHECQAQAQACLACGPQPAVAAGCWLGALVPHAGWICSGEIAGQAISALARQGPVDVVVVFGAIHTPLRTETAALDVHRRWRLPGGEAEVAWELSQTLGESAAGLFGVDERFHAREHAVEVEVPLIQLAWPGARLLPIAVPLAEQAVQIGQRTAQALNAAGLRAVYLASSDLTHYGPNYRFVPAGLGPQGLEWAKDNDRRLLELVTSVSAEAVVPEVRAHGSACGGGAVAAMLAACRELGASSATVLRHANSYETLAQVAPQSPQNAVGYAAVVVR